MRSISARTTVAALAAALILGGCASKPDEEQTAEAAAAAEAAAVYEPAESVRAIEIGTTRDGYVITAFGIAPGLGYGTPELRPRRDGRPGVDGFIDLDLFLPAPRTRGSPSAPASRPPARSAPICS